MENRNQNAEEKTQIWSCTGFDREYPDRLKNYDSMPGILYVKGELPQEGAKTAAIVGARTCSHYGAWQAYEFARILAEHGVQIISGLARGIDANAHKGALDGGGKTFAVMGCGVDICYPKQNEKLYQKILQGNGGILSEFPIQTQPFPGNFPRRNRIISALADLVLVIEARKKSGSLITAGYALEQGKNVYALPGRVGDALSEGCNRLIADGAGIAYSVEIILEELKISWAGKKDLCPKSKIRLASQEEMVYSCLDLQPKNIEEIFQEISLEPGRIAEILLKLELEGLIIEPLKNYYARMGG